MRITGVDKSERPGYLGDHYLGGTSIEVVKELFGRKSIRTSRTITMERPDLGLLNFIMDGPPLPGLNKYVKVKAPLGAATIKGEGSERGIGKKVEYVSLGIENATKRTSRLARMALNLASGYGSMYVALNYDDGLVVPDGVHHLHANLKDGVYNSEDGVTFGDPYLPHPKADEYPTLYGDTPDPQLINNKLFIVSNAPNLGDAYVQAAAALEQATSGEQPQDYFMELMAAEQGLEPVEFHATIAIARNEPPLRAARQILDLAAM